VEAIEVDLSDDTTEKLAYKIADIVARILSQSIKKY